jgi:hypothetical protein
VGVCEVQAGFSISYGMGVRTWRIVPCLYVCSLAIGDFSLLKVFLRIGGVGHDGFVI